MALRGRELSASGRPSRRRQQPEQHNRREEEYCAPLTILIRRLNRLSQGVSQTPGSCSDGLTHMHSVEPRGIKKRNLYKSLYPLVEHELCGLECGHRSPFKGRTAVSFSSTGLEAST